MRSLFLAFVFAMAVTFAGTSVALAELITFEANLTGGAEIPPNASTATGFTTVVLDTIAQTLHVQVTFSGLGSGTTASHIHCCVDAVQPPNGNLIVATTTPTFPGFPSNVTFGTYDHTL